MTKDRIAIPKIKKEKLLKEYNHLCAICGKSNPQIHHIDEDPSNNELNNLLPLCPNCHLIDQHNPTSHISPSKLKLFRKYKDPTILSSEFEPLFRRMTFLDDIQNDSYSSEIVNSVNELVEFVAALQMGNFYSQRIKELTRQSSGMIEFDEYGPNYEYERQIEEYNKSYLQKLIKNREQIYFLCIEMLRYQNWHYNSKN